MSKKNDNLKVDAKEAGDDDKPSTSNPSNQGKGKKKSKAKFIRDDGRMENFRTKTSDMSTKDNKEALYEKLFFGFRNVSEAMKNIQLQQTQAAGFFICGLILKFVRLGLIQADEAKVLSGALYRVTMLQINYKLEEAMIIQHSRNLDTRFYEDIFVSGDQRRALELMGANFSPLVNYISAIGFVKTASKCYLPWIPKVAGLSSSYFSFDGLRDVAQTLSGSVMSGEARRLFIS